MHKSLRSCPLDVVKQEFGKLSKKHAIAAGTIDPDHSETLQRFKRVKKAFGAHVEDKIVVTSEKGIANAVCGAMKHLPRGDTFFNRWPVPVLPASQMPTCSEEIYSKIFPDAGLPAEAADLGDDDGSEISKEIPEGHIIPFPHEHHWSLAQELAHVFRADVVIDLQVGCGHKMLGVLISANLRGVAVFRNASHYNYVHKRWHDYIKAKRLVPGFVPLSKPAELIQFEKSSSGLPPQTPERSLPSPSKAAFSPATPAPETPAQSSGSGLAAFGNISLSV
jgi:hypothetical protein